MSLEIQNIRRSHTSHITALLLPVIVIPLALMGVTVPKGFDAHAAAVAVEQAQVDIERCREIGIAQERFGGAEQLEVAREYAVALGSLVPRERSQIELYTHIREAAARSGLQLTSIRSGNEGNIGLPVDGTSIVMREMNVDGVGTLVSLVLFPRALYDAGVPATTLQAAIGRDRSGNSLFDIHLQLGVFHVVDDTGPAPDDASQHATNQGAGDR